MALPLAGVFTDLRWSKDESLKPNDGSAERDAIQRRYEHAVDRILKCAPK
jgi:hypothetical protein